MATPKKKPSKTTPAPKADKETAKPASPASKAKALSRAVGSEPRCTYPITFALASTMPHIRFITEANRTADMGSSG